ncbi:unnamed protein product [Notodromas monacha]|uniref:Lysophospholipid acyltransferase 7 n=1 Tax=Notodromas monacha TaxID=399045 RepID=A0A7R9BDK9_9CRUS|nr:unnamed protein product [Notodromas monacha]CAG0912539.1 unnamed protein product [Notodromas monacha]
MALLHDFIYLGSLIFCIAFGEVLRKIKNPEKRKLVATFLGVLIVFLLSGTYIIHPILMVLVNATIITYVSQRWCHVASFFFSFSYLIFCRSFWYLGLSEIPDFLNAVVMLLTLRVVGLAFEKNRGPSEKHDYPFPNFIDIVHYSCCYIGVLTGPYFRYSAYYDMLYSEHTSRVSCREAMLNRMMFVPMYLVLFFLTNYLFPVNTVESEEFSRRSWLYKFIFSNAVFFTFRMRMYSAFIISECVCINAGLGAYPKKFESKSGLGPTARTKELSGEEEYDFETVKNIDAYGSDFAPTVREGMRWWNMTVQYWLAVNIYKGLAGYPKAFRVAATMMVSSIWHGVYAGYYLSLLTVPFIMVVEDLYERRLRNRLSETGKAVYDWVSLALKMQWFAYMGMAFLLLRVDKTLHYWSSVYFAGHLLIVFLYVLGRIAFPKKGKSKIEDEEIKREFGDVRVMNSTNACGDRVIPLYDTCLHAVADNLKIIRDVRDIPQPVLSDIIGAAIRRKSSVFRKGGSSYSFVSEVKKKHVALMPQSVVLNMHLEDLNEFFSCFELAVENLTVLTVCGLDLRNHDLWSALGHGSKKYVLVETISGLNWRYRSTAKEFYELRRNLVLWTRLEGAQTCDIPFPGIPAKIIPPCSDLALLFLHDATLGGKRSSDEARDFHRRIKVYLSVSPVGSGTMRKTDEHNFRKRIRIHWLVVPAEVAAVGPKMFGKIISVKKPIVVDDEPRDGDLIGLFARAPRDWSSCARDESPCGGDSQLLPIWKKRALEIYDPMKFKDMLIVTKYQLKEFEFYNADLKKSRNMGFYCGYFRNGRVLSVASLSTHPTWMKELETCIGRIPLRNLMIPGTHGSGSYQKYHGSASESLFVKYAMTQEEDILNQLMLGIRYLDLRIGYYSTATPNSTASDPVDFFWLNHDFLKINKLRPALRAIKKFISNTQEIVILDIHRFPVGNFDSFPERHERLIDILVSTFGPWMAPRSMVFVTPFVKSGMLRLGKRLLVAYNHSCHVKCELLWPGIPRHWGNTNRMDSLESFMDSTFIRSKHSDCMWTISAALTPSFWDVATDRLNGLRTAADSLNHHLSKWLKTKYATSANIVAVDFFLSSDVIRTAIQCNLLRSELQLFGGSQTEVDDEIDAFRKDVIVQENVLQGADK